MKTLILPSAYAAPVPYYAHLYAHPNAQIEVCEYYIKQTIRNRCWVGSPNGPQMLTIPVEKSERGKMLMRDVKISDHGDWRHQHWNALKSYYERSPFFDYYSDDIRPFYERNITFLVDFNEELQRTLLEGLDLKPQFVRTEHYEPSSAFNIDFRNFPNLQTNQADTSFEAIPYYQVFAHKCGFMPHLSIFDLIFNMGPESRLVLAATNKHRKQP
ncbi:MAG: WbqC family protein [Bacteroidaceae bacterium]|nr:WbqC family protein [Bacteroidaceae bacterium]